jgi:hypothetical protein
VGLVLIYTCSGGGTVEVVKNKLDMEMKDYLGSEFQESEVYYAIKDMKSMAAPGPDGLPALFYHTYWDIIGKDVIKETLNILNHNGDPSLFTHSSNKKGFVGIKTDMAKAYDRVEWDFLQATLDSMGFPKNITNIIMKCVTSVTFSILINGVPSKTFSPQRGLRQGDPLSPYLFIISAYVLSGLITRAQNNKLIKGVKIAHGPP